MATESEYKEKFALRLLRSDDPLKAAMEVFPTDNAWALWASKNWVRDEEVIRFKTQLQNDLGELEVLPSKVDLLKKIWSKIEGKLSNDDLLKFMKLYAEVRAFIEKPAPAQINNVTNSKMSVMVVKDYATIAEWEQAAITQQSELTRVQ